MWISCCSSICLSIVDDGESVRRRCRRVSIVSKISCDASDETAKHRVAFDFHWARTQPSVWLPRRCFLLLRRFPSAFDDVSIRRPDDVDFLRLDDVVCADNVRISRLDLATISVRRHADVRIRDRHCDDATSGKTTTTNDLCPANDDAKTNVDRVRRDSDLCNVRLSTFSRFRRCHRDSTRSDDFLPVSNCATIDLRASDFDWSRRLDRCSPRRSTEENVPEESRERAERPA